EIRERTQGVWDKFYSLSAIWSRSTCVKSYKSRLAFVLISKLYRQMYANTGIATDSARVSRSAQWARLIARHTRRLFVAPPMPELMAPEKTEPRRAAMARQTATQTTSTAPPRSRAGLRPRSRARRRAPALVCVRHALLRYGSSSGARSVS